MYKKKAVVADHYDRFIEHYLTTYGTVIQSARPPVNQVDDLLAHEFESAHLGPGMMVLDAGCGVGGPAMYFAEREPNLHVYGVTISSEQQKLATTTILKTTKLKNVTIQCGDYHELCKLYPPTVFDRVLFLESLCHAENMQKVMKETWTVLKANGCIYIKDYFRIDYSQDEQKHQIQNVYYDRMERDYHVRFRPVSDLLSLLSSIGFDVIYVRSLPAHLSSDYDTAIDFERVADLKWRDGLPFVTSESMEIFARRPP